MVLKNKNLQKLEKVANRTPHYGIRKLTIGAASVLLGTTLWLGKDAVLAQAADQTNANEGSNDAKAVTESDKSADNSVDANTKVIVNSNQATDSSAAVASDKNSSAVVSQSGADKSQNITGNVNDSEKTNIENNQTSSAAKQSSAQSSVTQNNANNSTTSQKQLSPAARADNAIKEQAQSIQSKLSQSRNDIAASAESKLGLNADLTPAQQAQKSIQQAGNQGKVDLDNLDLTKGINAAANQTDANLGAKNVLGNKLALKANASNSSAVLQNNTNDSYNVDSNKSGASLVGGANVSANDGQNADTGKINKVVVDQNNQAQATSILSQGNDALIAAAKQSATELFDKKASSFEAPAALLASLAEEPNSSSSSDANKDAAKYTTATDWSGVQNAITSGAEGVTISGDITADGDLNIANGKSFTIVGADSNAALNLANHKISNTGNLTLENVTVNGSVMGNGTVNIKGTVSSNVSDANGYNLSTSEKNEHFTNWSQTKGYNIEANKVNIENNASLTINRSSVGDGIHLVADNSAVNVADYGHLTINMNTDNDLNTTARYHDAGIFAESNGNFTTGYKSVVTLNTSIGQGISMTGVRPNTTDDDRFGGYTADQSRPNGSGQINLGRYSTLNFTGRDGVILGNNSNFNVGDYANVHFENKGRGVALDLANNANINIGTHADTYFHSVGKSTKDARGHDAGPSGSFEGYNYIGVNEGGNITVNEYATFRVILEGRGANAWDDVVQLDSRGGNTSAAFTSKKGAIIDLRDDNTDFYGELISFPLGASNSKIDIEDPLYVNLQRYSSGGATTGWMPVGGDAINTTSSKYTSNLIYMSGTKGVLHIGGSDYVVYQQIKSDGTKQIWLNVNSVDFKKNGFNSLNPTNNNANPDISINGQGLVGGIKANQIRDDQSDPTHGLNAPAYGISTNRASHQVWVPHETTTEVTGTHKNTIHYVYEDGTQAAPDKTEEINLNRDLTLDITPSTLDAIQTYAQSHNADETLTYIRNSMTVTQDSGWKYTDQDGNAITNPYEVVDSPTIDGYTATVESTNAPGVTVGANGSEVKANFTMPATDAVVQDGKLTDAYKEHGTTGIPADYVTTIVYKKKQNHLAANIQEVNISQTIERDVQYKNNTGADGQGKYNITDPNHNATDRTNASGLPDMNPDDLVGDKDTKQTITLNGTAYFDKTTGSFIKVNSDGYAVDAQGRLVTYDDYGNLVVGHLDDTGKLVPTVDAYGNTTKTNYVQGGFTWTADYSKANGWNSPTANGYTRTPGTVTKFDANTPTNAKGITDAQGNTINNPTVQQVLDYLNRESANANNQKAISEDVIQDASNYPQEMVDKGIVPSNQYIFDQYQIVDPNNNELPVVITLSVNRDNPTGGVYMYATSKDYNNVYWSSMSDNHGIATPVNGSPAHFERTYNNSQVYQVKVYNFDNTISANIDNGYKLKQIFTYGAETATDPWQGDFKPREVTQTIKYVDAKTGQEIQGYPEVQVKGLIGQHFDASGVNPLTIAGYTLINNNAASGSISDYVPGNTYTRVWMDGDGAIITEDHTLKDDSGTMSTVVYRTVNGRRTQIGEDDNLAANGSFTINIPNTSLHYTITNPYVPSTSTVTLRYQKQDLSAQTNPYYVVYTPEDQRKSSIVVNFHDDTTDTEITNFNGQNIGFNSGELKPGTSVTYTTADNLKTLTDHGYVYVKTVDENGQEVTVPTTIPDKPETITVHLIHKIDTIDSHNPHGQKVTATVKRQINYTVDGAPDSSLPSHTETVTFNATGYYDEVTKKVVDLADGTTVDQGKVKLDQNGNETDGHLTWTYSLNDGASQNGDSTTFTGYTAPTKEGYHVNNVTVDPSADKDANADNTGLVKDLSVNTNSHDVTININLVKDSEEAAHLKIVDDTTGKTLNDNIDASGDENTPISFTDGQSTVNGYLQNGYKFVSVVNDATPNSPLSTTSYEDGAAKFGNYDTDPNSDQRFTVHLVHIIDRIDKDHPHNQNVTATVTRKVNYTVDGVPDSSLEPHTETVTFNATGYYDEVTKKVVDLADNTTIDQGKVKLDENGNVTDGHLTWTYSLNGGADQNGDSTTFTGYAVPEKAGYHVNNVTVDPSADKDANADDTGLVKDLSVNTKSHDVTITINLTKNAAEAAHLRIIDDTTGKILNDNINASGDESTPISFTNGQSTVDGYLQNGYKFVSVVNDADSSNPLSTTSYADGAAKFGNYDTDPNTDQRFTVHLAHKLDRIDTHNPYGQTVDKTITRKITYTVDGQPSSALPEVDQQAHFTATGVWDEVTKKVVDLTDNTTIDQGKVKLDGNGNIADGHLTWTLADGDSNFDAVDAPSVDSHHVDSDAIQVTPAGDASANVDSTGAVKGYTVNKDSDSVTINIPLVSNGTHLINQQTITTKATVHYVIDGDDTNKPAAPADNVQDNFTYTYNGDLVDNITGKVITPGHWNLEGSHAYNAVTSPTVAGYTPDKATVTSAQLTVSRTNPTVEVTVHYTKDAAEAAHLRIVDDTTGKTLNDNISASGDENTAINFTNGQATVDGYLQNGYKFVSVVNDGTRAILADGSKNQTYANANFGNYDTDPKTDQNFTVHLVHEIDTIDSHNPHGQQVTATVTRNVNYTVDGVADSTLPSHTETVTFNATGYYDEVTKKVVDLADHTTIDQGKVKLDQNGNVADGKLTWTYTLNGGTAQNGDSTTFTGYAVPRKDGYHVNSVTVNPTADKDANADSTGLVKDLSVNTKSHNVTITINLTKNAPAANVADIVNYIDDTTGQTLRTDNGNVINTLTGKPNDKVSYTTADIIQGYEGQGYRLVSNDFHDGQESFGNTGHTYNVHLAHKVETFTGDNPYGINAKATITRQVNYTVDGIADSTLPSHTETANFSGTGHYDLVEHKVVDMVNGQEKVTNGRVDDGHLTWAVDGGNEDSSTLTGYAVPTKAGYHVNNVTVDPVADKAANTDDTGLVKDLSVNHTSHNVTVTINLTKNGQTTKGQRTIDTSATVHYVIDGDDADKPAAPADSVQNGFQFHYTGDIYDATTGTLISNGHWTTGTSHSYNAVTSPSIDGYHTVTTVVPSSELTVTTDKPTVEITVHYIKNGQTVKNQQTINTSATVHYVVDGDDANKPAAPADNVQKGFDFKYSGDIYDAFTGQLIHEGTWNADSHAYDAVNTPALNGYHAEVTVVPASQLTVDRFNPDVVVTVHYVKNGQTVKNERDINTKATVHYVIDGDDANKPAAPADNVQHNFQFHYSGDIYDAVTGKFISNGTWNANTHAYDAVTSPTIRGYHAVVTVVPASQLTVTRDNPTIEVTVHYVKNGTTVRNQQTVTASQKVEYQDDQGNTLSPEKDQNFTFNYTGDTYDAVTGDLISRGHWTAASHNFTGENVPVINGYVAVSGYTKNGDNYTAGGFDTIPTASDAERNRTFIVVYNKTGKIIPVDPNHNPIPNVPTPEYPNDPKNPTNVTPNEPVPTIPGYTPETPTVTPTDPTKDTPVIYNPVAKDQNAVVNYIDLDNNNQQIATSGPLSGKSGAKIDYSTTTTLNDLISKGYILVNNGFDPNGEVQYYDNDDTVTQTYLVTLRHGHSPVNPNHPHNGVDPSQYEKTVKETVHYEGAGDKTPADNVQTSKWSRTLTIDNVTGKIVSGGQYDTDWSIEPGQKTVYDQVDTPVIDGYHADHANVPATQVTQDDITKVVVYSPNGKIVPVDPNGNPIPSAPTPQYPTDPKNPTNVTPNEPVPTVPGYTPTQPTVTPTDPGKDTPVVYVKDQVAQVVYRDVNDPDHYITLGTDTGLTGKAGDAVKDDQVPTKIQDFENAGYVLVNNGFTGAVFDDVADNTQTFYVDFKHDTITINPKNPGKPGQPINPNDPNGPKWSDDTDVKHLTKDGTQTIHYQGAGDNTPKDNVQKTTFNHEEVIDKVTGKVIADHGWSPDSHTFGTVTTPVVNGYHADRTTAGGATVTPDNPDATIVVSYSPNGKIIPVDPNGNPIPNAPQPQYPTSPDNPTTVTPD